MNDDRGQIFIETAITFASLIVILAAVQFFLLKGQKLLGSSSGVATQLTRGR